MKILHLDSMRAYAPGEPLVLHGGLWQVIGWEKRGAGYRITVEKC
jgi:hypothetical protein